MRPPLPGGDSLRHAGRRHLHAWIALVALLGLSAGAAQLHLGAINLWVSLGIALLKIGIVGWVFMGLDAATKMQRIATATGVAAWLLLASLSVVDLMTRHEDPVAWQSPQGVAPTLSQPHASAQRP